jgi:hypothetical protein
MEDQTIHEASAYDLNVSPAVRPRTRRLSGGGYCTEQNRTQNGNQLHHLHKIPRYKVFIYKLVEQYLSKVYLRSTNRIGLLHEYLQRIVASGPGYPSIVGDRFEHRPVWNRA